LLPGAMEDGSGEDGRVVVTDPDSDPADLVGERKPSPCSFDGEPFEETLMATRQEPIASLK
jgi:hypothetical protein